MKSEIHLNEEFGYNIFQMVVRFDLRQNLEIGSWDGEGSTRCFVEAMKLLPQPKSLHCVEIVPEKFKTLKERYADLDFVHCFNGSSICYADLLYKDFEEIWNSPHNKLKTSNYSKETVRGWFDRDIQTIKESTSLLSADMDMQYDSVLIDGSEFTGYSEFQLLKNKTRVFFLDDVHKAFKCNEIYHKLKTDPDWYLLLELPNARNGAAIFTRKD